MIVEAFPWSHTVMRTDLPETRRDAHDLAVNTFEAVVRKCFTRIALTTSATHPGDPRAASRPFDERSDSRRQRISATIVRVMNDQRTRQRRRGANDGHAADLSRNQRFQASGQLCKRIAER